MNRINLILHAHLPYVRHLEYPKFLEENWLFESMNESYLPLLRMLESLDEKETPFKLMICFSPTLSTMLKDRQLMERFIEYMELRIDLGVKEAERTLTEDRDAHFMALKYLDDCRSNLDYFLSYGSDILGAYKNLSERGRVGLMATAATHAFLPLYKDYPEAVKAQISVGLDTHYSTFGNGASGFWLPDCGYYPGLERLLSQCDVKWVQLAAHSVVTAKNPSQYCGYRPVKLSDEVLGFVRHWSITNLVLSDTAGYPCDADYRDFYRDIGYSLPMEYVRPYVHEPSIRAFTGYKYYAVTGKTNDKKFYDYGAAMNKVSIHADNFLHSINRKGREAEISGIKDPIITLAFDAELFGHRWYEGIKFLEKVLVDGGQSESIEFTTPDEIIGSGTETDNIRINECSWIPGGFSDTFLDNTNRWVYRHIFKALDRISELADRFPSQGTLKARFLNQASRELLLAMSSDWPCIMHDNTSVSYAEKRLMNHLGSFNVVYNSMLNNTANTRWLISSERRNKIFRGLDYRIFCKKK